MATAYRTLFEKLSRTRAVKGKKMTEEQASEAYWKARDLLQEVIDSGHRGSKEEILDELQEEDLN